MKRHPVIIILLALAGMASSLAAAQDRAERLPAALAEGWQNLLARQAPAGTDTAAVPLLDSALQTTVPAPVGSHGILNWSVLLTEAVDPATLLPANLSATLLAVWLLGDNETAKPLPLTRWLQESARRWAADSRARLIYRTLDQAMPPDPSGSLPVLFAAPLPGEPPPEPWPLLLEPVTPTLK